MADKTRILFFFTLNCQIKTLTELKKVKAPSREALAPFRADETSRSKTLAPLGPLQHATRATAAQSASKMSMKLDDVMVRMGTS
jgi:hypothetical protein